MEKSFGQVDVCLAPGSLHREDLLVEWLQKHALTETELRAGRSDSIRLIVPSSGLRTHLSSRLVTRLRGPLLGIRIQTLYGLAREILELSGEPVNPAGLLEGTFVARATQDALHLGPVLSKLSQGLRAPLRSVRDLLDSGSIHKLSLPQRKNGRELKVNERTSDLVAIAAETSRLAQEAGLDLTGSILARAAALVEKQGLPWSTRGVGVFGFEDVTGVGVALLRSVLAETGGAFFVDLPPGVGPGRQARLEKGSALQTAARIAGQVGGPLPGVPKRDWRVTGFGARGPAGESLECARRVRDLLDAGVPAERIGLVLPSFEGYGVPLRRQFRRLGIPCFGGRGEAPPRPLARWRVVSSLLEDPMRVPADEFLALIGQLEGQRLSPVSRNRLCLGVRSLGMATLGQLSEGLHSRLPQAGFLTLPFVCELAARRPGDPSSSRRLKLSVDDLIQVSALSSSVLEAASLPDEFELAWGKSRLLELIHRLDDEAPIELLESVEAIPAPEGFVVQAQEMCALVREALVGLDRGPIGGRGGGVALLTSREARGWTFEHLFVLGANRGLFPRPGGDDPLLPERERTRLRSSLPLLPRTGSDPAGERYRVAQLLSSSPNVTLSWQTAGGDGKPLSVAPLAAYLLGLGDDGVEPVMARTALPLVLPVPSPLEDYVMRAGLYGNREELGALLELGLSAASADEVPSVFNPTPGLAHARAAILDETDPDLGSSEGQERWNSVGPYLGQIGPKKLAEDPRFRVFSAHSLEGTAVCPWRSLLQNYLGLKEMPDPNASVPQASTRLVGLLVHEVLEQLVLEEDLRRGGTLGELLESTSGVRLPAPSTERLAEVCLELAHGLLAREGLVLPGLAEILQRRAQVFVEGAFAEGALPPFLPDKDELSDAERPAPQIVGVEVEGEAEVAGHRVAFRADRVDRVGEELVFVDYKAGKPISRAVLAATRSKAYQQAVAQGTKLQAGIYSCATGPQRSRGRYLFLRPDIDEPSRRVDHSPDDDELKAALEETVMTLADGVDSGQMFPRVVGPGASKEPPACSNCSVAAACVRGDSGARGRLVRHASHLEHEGRSPFLALWQLPRRGKEGK